MIPLSGPDLPDLHNQPMVIVVEQRITLSGPYDPARALRCEFALAPSPRRAPVEEGPDAAGAMHITRPVHDAILDALTSRPPEAGGMLLGPSNHHAVTHFILDEHARATSTSFTLDHVGLNKLLKRYAACGIDMKGFVHSHPANVPRPSSADIEYVLRTFANPKNAAVREFLLPIVCGGEFYPYLVIRGADAHSGDVVPATLVLF